MVDPPAVIRSGARVVRDSQRWFTEGLTARREAKRLRQCVECRRDLPSRRTPYCSRTCQWRFHGRFFWDAARRVVLRRDRFTCRWCGRRGRKAEMEVDHVFEIALGGPSLDYANLQTLCRPCHRRKTRQFLRIRPVLNLGNDGSPTERAGPEWFPA